MFVLSQEVVTEDMEGLMDRTDHMDHMDHTDHTVTRHTTARTVIM